MKKLFALIALLTLVSANVFAEGETATSCPKQNPKQVKQQADSESDKADSVDSGTKEI